MGTSGTLRHTLHLTTTNGTPYLVLGTPYLSTASKARKGSSSEPPNPKSKVVNSPKTPRSCFERSQGPRDPLWGLRGRILLRNQPSPLGVWVWCLLFMSLVWWGGEGEMLYCITNRLNKGLISVDRNKRMLLYYLQYPVPTFKSSAKDLSHPIFGIVFQRATDTACVSESNW